MIERILAAIVVLAVAAMPTAGSAQPADLIVEKKTFELASYTTAAGATIKSVKVGWQAAGTLNAGKSNAILITHFFSGTGHAFGKYAASDHVGGYWERIIGPGKLIDTNKYYVISSDTLVNLNVKLPSGVSTDSAGVNLDAIPNVVTTGPASINPDTGRPYGMSFPVVSIKDFVNVQKALIDSLGIRKLKAVMGASLGAQQAYEWAASYPDHVERIIPIVGTPGAHPFAIGWFDAYVQPIRLDPKWNGGDYYDREPPLDGLKAAFKVMSLHANHYDWAAKTFGLAAAEDGKDPAKAYGNKFKIEAELDSIVTERAAITDANSVLYMVKASQLAAADPARIKAPVLMIHTPTDLVLYAPYIKEAAKRIAAANGGAVELVEVTGPYGHINGVIAVEQAAAKIKAFLERR
jgi:homoserine O-acetyltransferase